MFAITERLLLRPGWAEDAPALFNALADEAIVRNLASAPWPYTLGDAEAFLAMERPAAAPSMLIFRRTRAALELIGAVGFSGHAPGEAELGYWIARPHWGRGYATEAARAVLANARGSLRMTRITAGHFLDNPASGRVLAKLGFRPTGVAPRHGAGRREVAPCREYVLTLDAEEDVANPERIAA